jgi:hypothetical protein
MAGERGQNQERALAIIRVNGAARGKNQAERISIAAAEARQ